MMAVSQQIQSQSLLLRPVGSVADIVIEEAMKYIGTPYKWGGKSPKGFDCAGFTRYIYGKFGVSLAPYAGGQSHVGKKIKDNEIQKGDLVFYGGRSHKGHIGHVGIVTSVDSTGFYFIHASTTLGVCVSSSREPYYRSRYVCACRIIDKVVTNLPKDTTNNNTNIPVYRQVRFANQPVFNYLNPNGN